MLWKLLNSPLFNYCALGYQVHMAHMSLAFPGYIFISIINWICSVLHFAICTAYCLPWTSLDPTQVDVVAPPPDPTGCNCHLRVWHATGPSSLFFQIISFLRSWSLLGIFWSLMKLTDSRGVSNYSFVDGDEWVMKS